MGALQLKIKNLKNNTPCETKINKTILKNLLTESLNIALSIGSFPDIFKHVKLKLILKVTKQPTNSNNYIPISLLEVQGKFLEKS